MPFVKGKSGNAKGRPPAGKSLTEALRMTLKRDGNLQRFVEKTLALAQEGHGAALNQVWDRIDGKVAQPIEGGDKPITVNLQWGSTPEWLKK